MPRRIRSTVLPGWRDPQAVFLDLAVAASRVAWLDGGDDATTGRSVIAIAAEDAPVVLADGDADPDAVYAALAAELDVDASQVTGGGPAAVGWYGWFGYEFGARTLGVPAAAAPTPEVAFFLAGRVIVFDHGSRTIRLEWLDDDAGGSTAPSEWVERTTRAIERIGSSNSGAAASVDRPDSRSAPDARPASTRWRHEPGEYRRLIAECQAAITRGDAYQLCLTNRVDVDVRPDPVAAYLALRASSPSHHGGLVRIDEVALLSASPEQFLLVAPDGTVATKPMKGTRPRSADPTRDAALRAELHASEKERAENLMIVDLMRNDLGRIAELGSVRVPDLLVVEEYAHVHQLVSTVTARLRHPLTALDAVRSAFPAGSMTGAPKLSAMTILHGLERGPRGVYSGAFGCLGVDGTADLAMVIRSIVLTPDGASIGTGGGITALSDPDEEVEETRVKARALIAVLGGETPGAWVGPAAVPPVAVDDDDAGRERPTHDSGH
ncbi:anthranilate synthase component I family protein [Agromyces binzhouensis]|uniref:Anthranilate synthase component I family protein n=1 Tax=Agromyces binzhouensis TaxID=1817495 RepID=A0A4Q2JP27_9MICO|nr:anthranilate synthase component I family protein [Agromyces binzhouensis]RXZ48047.1 anthranilate synthase component I family protein [Agromyces binzhouensis]